MPLTSCRSLLVALVTALCLTTTSAALAQEEAASDADTAARDEEARSHFRLAQAQYEVGHFAEAAEAFERAYALSGRAQLLYNLYLAHRDAGHLVEAAEALRNYLERATEIEGAPLLRARLEALDEQIARMAREPEEAAVEPSPIAEPEPTPLTPAPSDDLAPAGWALIGVGGAVSIGGAVMLGVMAADLASVESAAPGTPFADVEAAYQRTEPLSIAGFVSVGVGVALVAVGAVLLALPRDAPRDRLALRIGPGALSLSGSF